MFQQFLLILSLDLIGMQRLLDQRQNVKFMVGEGLTPAQCHARLETVYGPECMSKPTVRRWHARFREGDGHTPVTDLNRCGRPRLQSDPQKIVAVQDIINQDRCVSLKEVAQAACVSVSTAHRMIKKDLHLNQKCAKYVPRVLTDEQRRARVRFCSQNLDRVRDDPHLLDKVICGDESPVYLHDPESKQTSKEWLPKGALRPQKALRLRSQKRTMLTAFFDARGLVHAEYTETSIDTDSYIQTLRNLREKIRQKRPFMWKGGIDGKTDCEFILQHDNASCHTSVRTLAYLFDQDMLAHPPYSPDLAPCDYYFFPVLKRKLRGHRHRNLRDLKTATTRTLKEFSEQDCQEALSKLPWRWRKCVKSEGHYFEGRGVELDFDPYFDLGPNYSENEEEDSD